MTNTFKTPVNYRATPVRVGAPEVFTISGGLALLAEAPADPTANTITVTVGGVSRTRVDAAPGPGQYRILTQVVAGIGTEWLPVLQFDASDEGASGLADYYGTGTILTAQFFSALLAFLTPLVGYTAVESLPTPTMDQSQRGRRGDVAFLVDGTGFFSDGVQWVRFGSSGGAVMLGTAMAMALDAGYVGPALVGAASFGGAFDHTLDGSFVAAGSWAGDITLAETLAVTVDAVQAEVGAETFAATYGMTMDAIGWWGDLTIPQTLALSMDAVLDWAGSPENFAATFGTALDGTWAAGSTPLDVSDNFNRANGGLGANWTTLTGRNAPTVNGNLLGQGTHPSAAYWSHDTFAADQYSELNIVFSGVPGVAAGGPAVRCSASAQTCYCALVTGTDDGKGGIAGYDVGLFKYVAGSKSAVGSAVSIPSDATVVRLEVSGTSLVVKSATSHGGTYTSRITQTDSAIASGSAGVLIDNTYDNTQIGDNWYGGNL